MHNKTRTRLWWAAIATALAMLVCGIASAQGDASALLAIVTDSAWTPAKLGPGAWYQGEYDAIDSSGNWNNGSWVGTPAYTNGQIGQALSFSGSSAVTPSTFETTAGDFSISAWIKTTVSAGIITITGASSSSTTPGCWVTVSSGKLYIRFTDSTPYRVNLITGGTYSDATWHHVVVVAKRTSLLTVYVDGFSVASESISSATNTVPYAKFIGAEAGSSITYGFDGAIDDLQTYSRALTPAEITKLYTESVKQAAKGTAW